MCVLENMHCICCAKNFDSEVNLRFNQTIALECFLPEEVTPLPHCISNAERMILYKIAFPTAKTGVLNCQKKTRIGNRKRSIYVLHRQLGNPKRIYLQFRTHFVNEIGCSQWPLIRCDYLKINAE